MNEIARIIREHRYVWRKPFDGPEFLMCYCGWRAPEDLHTDIAVEQHALHVAEVLEKIR